MGRAGGVVGLVAARGCGDGRREPRGECEGGRGELSTEGRGLAVTTCITTGAAMADETGLRWSAAELA